MNGSMNAKKMMNDVTTGNEAEFAAITPFLFFCCDNNLGKRDYNPDKQHEEQMKLIRHGAEIVAVIEHQREKAYLISQRGKQEWVSLFLVGETTPVAEMNTINRQVRLCAGQTVADEQEVVLHDH